MQIPFPSVVLVFSLTIIAAGPATAQESSETPWFDAEALPISLERIKRQLDRLPVRDEERNLLYLSYYCGSLRPSTAHQRRPELRYPQRPGAVWRTLPRGDDRGSDAPRIQDAGLDVVPAIRVDGEGPLAKPPSTT